MAGLVFYGSAVLCIGLFVSGHAVPGGAVLAIMFGLPLLLIFFKEPLTNLVEKKAEVMPKEKGMFIVQGIFELFEVILSYFSNTLSFGPPLVIAQITNSLLFTDIDNYFHLSLQNVLVAAR